LIGLLCLCRWAVCAAPEAPTSLQLFVSDIRIDLLWTDNSTDEDGFVIERQVDTGLFETLDTLLPNDTHHAEEGLASGHIYTYRIYAFNADGNSEYSNAVYGNISAPTFTVRLETTGQVADTFLSPLNPNQNAGDLETVSDFNARYLFKYNFPAELQNKRVLKADLHIYGQNHSGPWSSDLYMDLYRVSTDWESMEATWNNAKSGAAWNNAGGDYDKFIGQVQIAYFNSESGQVVSPETVEGSVYYPPADVTDMVKRWVRGEIENFGMLLVNDTNYFNQIAASENGNRAYLDITYLYKCECDYAADFNYDCAVDLIDLAMLANQWQTASLELDIAPPVGDGFVNLADFAKLADQWLLACDEVGGGGEGGEE
jgi:hypothetical protein